MLFVKSLYQRAEELKQEGLAKSHVKQYTKADGTVVQEHDDSRQEPHHVDPDFAAGMKARMKGKMHFESPHKHHSPRGQQWLKGWQHQKDQEDNKGMHKSHVKAYTRSDGTVVQEHDDSRRKTIPERKQEAEQSGHVTGNYAKIKSGFGEGKIYRISNVSLLDSKVHGEISQGANFYPVSHGFHEVEIVPKPNYND